MDDDTRALIDSWYGKILAVGLFSFIVVMSIVGIRAIQKFQDQQKPKNETPILKGLT